MHDDVLSIQTRCFNVNGDHFKLIYALIVSGSLYCMTIWYVLNHIMYLTGKDSTS